MFKLIPGYDPIATAGNCHFDPAVAQKPIDFFAECLHHIEGAIAGKPFLLEPWQQAIVGCLFGWLRPDGTRRYRECLIYVARKNGKTPTAAGIALYMLLCEDEPGQQNLIAAGDKDQASLLYRHARGMVEAEPELMGRCKIYKGYGQRSILSADETSGMRVISSEADTKHGGNLHLGIIDELHVQKNRDLVDVIQTSMASLNRRQPLLLYITTADFERPGSICNEKHDYAGRVRDGILDDPAFLPVIFEATLDDDWRDEAVWAKANPNLNVSVSLDYLRRECKRAQDEPSYENTFKRLHLNVRTEQDVRWLPMESWAECEWPFDVSSLHGSECYAGLDLATTQDMTAMVLAFPQEDGRYILLCRFWIPADSAARRDKRNKTTYQKWIREGFITATPGNETDYERIRKDINAMGNQYGIRQIAVDRLFQGAQLGQQLASDGFDIVAFGQGFYSMASPAKEFERLVMSGKLNHLGNPVLRWHAGNVSVEQDAAGNLKPSKKRSSEKIDGIVSAIMAIGRAAGRVEATSVYDGRGLVVL